MTIHQAVEAAENLPATVEIALPEMVSAEAFFGSKDAVAEAVAKIEATVRAHVPDLTTKKGRDAIASLAYRVSKSKTYLDGEGKKLVEGIKKQAEGVDKARKLIRDRLDALRDEARAPLDKWQADEAARQARDAEIMASLRNHGMTGQEASADIVAKASQINAIALPEDFTGDPAAAEGQRQATLQALRSLFIMAQQREKDAAELVRLRAEAEEREAKEAKERAEREAAEAAARKAEAERQAAREKAEAEARAERERAEQAEEARKAAEARAAAEIERAEQAEEARKAAEARAAAEIERAKREAAEWVEKARAEAAAAIERERQEQAEREAQAERQRQEAAARAQREAEEKAAAEAAEKARREADEQRRAEVFAAIEAKLLTMTGRATPRAIAEALMAGEIPHVQVVL